MVRSLVWNQSDKLRKAVSKAAFTVFYELSETLQLSGSNQTISTIIDTSLKRGTHSTFDYMLRNMFGESAFLHQGTSISIYSLIVFPYENSFCRTRRPQFTFYCWCPTCKSFEPSGRRLQYGQANSRIFPRVTRGAGELFLELIHGLH